MPELFRGVKKGKTFLLDGALVPFAGRECSTFESDYFAALLQNGTKPGVAGIRRYHEHFGASRIVKHGRGRYCFL